jgi:predicted kinase
MHGIAEEARPLQEASRGDLVPTLFLICGLPGSGKTTVALALERDCNAVRFAPDEWMARIVGDGWDHERREAVEEVQWTLAQRLLTLGLNVALENGFWRRTERQAYRARASELGADSKIIYCDVGRDELKRRLVARNADLPSDTFVVTPEQLDEMWPHFEPPGEDELQ